MFLLKHIHDFRFVNPLLRYSSIATRSKNHYDVLNLRKNCTEKEIKEAFIHMSKEYHPDKNSDPKAQQKFVMIVEAYNVLSKPSSRARYDRLLEYETVNVAPSYHHHNYKTYDSYGFRNPNAHYHNAYTHHTNTNTSSNTDSAKRAYYYGVSGVKRVPNYVIILLCFGIAFVGTVLQFVVIREMYVVHKRQAMERSRSISEELERVRSVARNSTNEAQTRRLMEKIVSSSNPTVATASLGQALANEKELSTDLFGPAVNISEIRPADLTPDDDENYVSNGNNQTNPSIFTWKILSELKEYITIYDD